MPEKLKLAIEDKNFSLPPETEFFNTIYCLRTFEFRQISILSGPFIYIINIASLDSLAALVIISSPAVALTL